jgi:hypothetical protein
MLPKELLELLNGDEATFLRIQIDATDFTMVDPVIDFSLVSRFGKKTQQQWSIMIKGHMETNLHTGMRFKFVHREKPRLEILDQHPLLLGYNSRSGCLYFKGKSANPDKLFTDLYKAHFAFCGTHSSISEHLHGGIENLAMLNASYGLFAQGPRPLLQEYARCLEQHGITCNILEHQPLQMMKDEKQVEAKPQMQILLLDESYFIGEQFVFAKR